MLDFAGFDVTREYYINDAGRQMDILALSTWLRYLALFGIAVDFPPNAYQGDYVKEMAAQIRGPRRPVRQVSAADVLLGAPSVEADKEGHLDALIANAKRLLGPDYAWVHGFALTEQLGDGREDLKEFGVTFDMWFSERSLFDTGLVEGRGCARRPRSSVRTGRRQVVPLDCLRRREGPRRAARNGLYTYFASDIAYHANKYERGFDRIIDIWGADHHGYIPRVKGALQPRPAARKARRGAGAVRGALPGRPEGGDVHPFRRVRHAARVAQRSRQRRLPLFLRAAQGRPAPGFRPRPRQEPKQREPGYYIQYAHARLCSVLGQWNGVEADLADADLACLDNERELALCARLTAFPEVVQNAASDYAPHQIAFYLKDLAGEFHSYYNAERMLVDDEGLKLGPSALAAAVRQVIRNGLALLAFPLPIRCNSGLPIHDPR